MSYTDATPPAAFSTFNVGDLREAVPGETGASVPKVQYALYEDSSTWSSWTTWAKQNALDYTNTANYSSRAFQVVGNWPTISGDYTPDDGEEVKLYPTMCFRDKSTSNNKGTFCVEGNRSADDVYTTTTYWLTDSESTTNLDALDDDGAGFKLEANYQLRQLDFATYAAGGAVAESTSEPYKFLSFEVMNCSLNSIQMNCINWVASTDYDRATSDNSMYNRWTEGGSAQFYWFDPEYDLTAENVATDLSKKWAHKTIDLKYDSTTTGAISLYTQAVGMLVAASVALAF